MKKKFKKYQHFLMPLKKEIEENRNLKTSKVKEFFLTARFPGNNEYKLLEEAIDIHKKYIKENQSLLQFYSIVDYISKEEFDIFSFSEEYYSYLQEKNIFSEQIDSLEKKYLETKESIYGDSKKENYNLKTSKEVKKAYHKAMDDMDNSKDWNNVSNGAEKERKHYFKLHPELKKSKESKMNLKNYLQKKLTISPKESELIESVFKDYVLKNKKTAMKEFNAFLIPLKDFISKYSDEIKPSEGIEGIDSFFEKMDKKYPKFNLVQMYSSLKSKNKFDYDLLKKHYSSVTEKKESTLKLKDYLHKKLTISEKEASFIELAVKEYVQKKKQVKETFPKRKLKNPDYDYDMSSLENDESMEYHSSYSNDPLADEKPAIPYPEDEEEDFYSRPEFAKNPNFRRPPRTQKR